MSPTILSTTDDALKAQKLLENYTKQGWIVKIIKRGSRKKGWFYKLIGKSKSSLYDR